ncbi:betaine-aldehyde dehydrogenase [Staphylococcus pseudintermedius]|uniref:betaine-aldehyde dehydrogenase n=1 Tax=Staphylococcus pseudintermedius TaxID=283734 RepID=UPI0001F6C35A|nr:betaine-aldehyde dehydrogenase [Staphylococcus pseudintermedius]ADV06758.1 Betaine aldehyde dehydrogenase [Staphylococcus pseudintermedius HKU10-03]EGQ1752101.1 betaine-aldehyde dehydrogenase [Staphylococcus pseudintermedius]EGQ3217742.1 betaine-aldehyde dehydrogenase [Staphylococcus pseudintermedius]EGQ3364427.1 betaine-aldehyde dehydrogenase [Staphylococcus pseudintermedius]EGQ3433369.1 betaine-aldehyde dehydrogenase [Staphylococcus pseudintermedius]
MEAVNRLSRRQYIDGEWVESSNKATREIINPYNQEVILEVAEGTEADVERAILAARRAFDEGHYANETGEMKGQKVRAIADKIKENREELAYLETLDTGKTYEESLVDMDDIHNVFMYFAGLADKDGGELINSPIENTESKVVKEPIGVVTQITPWNYPLLQASWKIAPALATGCSLVMKPSEITPLTTIRVFELMEEVGFPKGVINLVLGAGSEIGDVLSSHPEVDLVSFTGGIKTGKHIMKKAADHVTNIALELGGKNPNIIFDDADFDLAVDQALNGGFFHAGQVCSAGSRIIVHNSIKDKFEKALIDAVKKIRLGNGFDKSTELGPLISAEHRAKVENYMEVAKEDGATIAVGGQRPEREDLQNGFFFEPTVITDCDTSMRIVQEEVFGPVVTVEGFETEEEAIRLANDSIYGLAGGVFTKDIGKAQRVASKMRMGTVWINDFHPYFAQAPWGGYKQSGIGRELGHQGLEEYLETKHILMNTNPEPVKWFSQS